MPTEERDMFDIFIETHFAGAHHLREYPGNCEKPHGHNWKVKVTVRAMQLDTLGMGIDFKVLKKTVNAVVDELDHRDLNEHPAFISQNPSSENISVYLFDQLKPSLNHDRYQLHSVTVYETETSGLTYYGHNP
jgi:6-pyruvoyltetrahydropterin/6-carboxytetrahydropterin synthase